LVGARFDGVIKHPDDPTQAVQWRMDAAAALEAASATK